MSANTDISDSRSFSNNFTAVKDSSKTLQNTNSVFSDGENKSRSGSLNFSLNNYPMSNPIGRFALNGSVNIRNNESERNARSIFDSYTNPAADTGYNRLYNNNQESISLNLNLNYSGLRRLLFRRFNLFGVELVFNQGLTYSNNKANALVSDYDSTGQKFQRNNQLSNNNQLQTLGYNPALSFQKNFSKWSSRYSRNFNVSVRLVQRIKKENNISSFAVRNVERSFSFFTPSFSLGHNYGLRDKFMSNVNLGFARDYTYPGIDQLYTITDSLNVYSVRFGNPGLKNTRIDNANFNFSINKRKPKAKYEIGASVSGSMNFKTNPIADSVINDISGKRLMYYVNADDGVDYNLNYSANISRKIKKSSIQLQYSGNMGNSRNSNFIDGIESVNRNNNISHNINLQFSLRTLLILKLSEVISTYSSNQSGSGLASYKVNSASTQFGATLNVSKNFSFNTTVSTTDNSNVADKIILWHAFSSYRFLKGKEGELKFSAFDLLKKFQNINVNTNIDGTSTTVTNGLQQYFLLTFSYYPRKFGKKGSDD
ncbi:MAG: hypothetical protein EOO03_00185 [Chitinophagaceae bacterium]|nr:MAG: hypothetical protein EOO03_00185 [Chitinophagaceae bacterium]